MKNKHLNRLLSITLASALVIPNVTAIAYAEEDILSSEPAEEPYVEPDPEPYVEPDPEPYVEPDPEPYVEPDPEPYVEPDPEPIVEPEPDPDPTETPVIDPTETPSADPTDTPVSPTDTPISPTETPSADPTETPSPSNTPGVTPTTAPTDTPTPSPSNTPTPGVSPTTAPTNTPTPTDHPISPSVQTIINRINALAALAEITIQQQQAIREVRTLYNALPEEDKALVTNYETFLGIEKKLSAVLESNPDPLSDGTNADALSATATQLGQAVYYSNYVSNLHAGKEFYLNSLKQNYALSFSDDFAEVMDEIEKEYKEKYKLQDITDQTDAATTSSADALLVRNWQDILAVYVYQQSSRGATSYNLSRDSKGELARIFAEMNPVERDRSDITKVAYGTRHINYFIKKNNISKADREVLKKYTETDCKLLCAVVTASKGFVRQSVGEGVSEERVNVIAAAYSLVGQVGYFYGGKSNTIGYNDSWGSAEKVTATGSTSTGTLRAYGLDCSGFVSWSVINGYQDTGMQDAVGDGTSEQWEKANLVAEDSAQPGDFVFLAGPERTGADNHVGILCGRTDAGDWIAVHCSSAKNGVTVGEAYSASFRYIRQPSFYPTQEEVQEMEASGSVVAGLLSDMASGAADSEELLNLIDDSLVEPFELTSEPIEPDSEEQQPAQEQAQNSAAAAASSSMNWNEVVSPYEPATNSSQAVPVQVPAGELVDNSVVEPF